VLRDAKVEQGLWMLGMRLRNLSLFWMFIVLSKTPQNWDQHRQCDSGKVVDCFLRETRGFQVVVSFAERGSELYANA
jgi:hypothetical protein